MSGAPRPAVRGEGWDARRVALVVTAAIGAAFLLIVAVNRWGVPSDEQAYWLAAQRLGAGQPLYDPAAVPGTPYAYWYPPPLAQVLAPFTLFVPDLVYMVAWTVLLLGCQLAGETVARAVALPVPGPVVPEAAIPAVVAIPAAAARPCPARSPP